MRHISVLFLLLIPVSIFAQAPTISNITTIPQMGAFGIIRWETSALATERVFYDTVSRPLDTDGTQYAFSTFNDVVADQTFHVRNLPYLTPNTTYFYKLRSANGGGTTFSSELSFTTATNGVRTTNLLIIRLNFPNDSTSGPSDSTVNANMTTINNFMEEYSFGQSDITWDIVPGTLTSPNTTSFYKDLEVNVGSARRGEQLGIDASDLALGQGFNTNSYDMYVVWIPQLYDWTNSGYFSGYKGISAMHPNVFAADYVIMANLISVVIGVSGRANGWDSNDSTVFGSSGAPHSGGIANPFDMLGGESVQNNLNLKHKLGAAWILPANIHQVTTNGTYRIFALDTETTLDSNRKYGIRMPSYTGQGTQTEYWIEFRQTTPTNGLLIDWGGLLLLDMTPSTETFDDAKLVAGNTFTDPDNRTISFIITAGSPSFADVIIGGLAAPSIKICNWGLNPRCNQ